MKTIAPSSASTTRSFTGQRWVNISLRTLHLFGIAGTGSAYLYELPIEAWQPYLLLTVMSGALMMLIETWSFPGWLLQLRGLSMLLKLLILALGWWTGTQPVILVLVILISGLIAHAPGKVRYYTPFKRS